MELRHIRYFIAAAEELNITKAAEKLNIAQPPLSRQIRDLEEELGATLFVRKNHGLQLTEEGHHFLNYARQMLNLEAKAKEEILELDKGLQGILRLDSIDGQGPHLMTKWLAGFHKKYPMVQFSMWKGNSDEVQHRLQKGLSDIGIVLEPYNRIGFEGAAVYEEPWVVLIPAEHPLAKWEGDSIPCEELSRYPIIIPGRNSRRREIDDWFAKSGNHLQIMGDVAHGINAYEAAAQNLGLCIYPAAASALIHGNEVIVKKLSDPEVHARYVLTRSEDHVPTRAAQKFWDYIIEEVRSSEGADSRKSS